MRTLQGSFNFYKPLVEVCTWGTEDKEMLPRICRLLQNTSVLLHHEYYGYQKDNFLAQRIRSMRIGEAFPTNQNESFIIVQNFHISISFYKLYDRQSSSSVSETEMPESCFEPIRLPTVCFEGIWEELHFDSDLKGDLLQLCKTMLRFAECGIDFNSLSRMILLYGEPGTGKTSLCHGLSQKIAVRSDKECYFLEVKTHELLSKWFGESGKMIANVFQKINLLALDKKRMIFLLIDEVESLALSRSFSLHGNEPSDGIRAVNVLLNQLDKLKHSAPNVTVLATSNVLHGIDAAFLDRVDLTLCVNLPGESVIYKLLHCSIDQLLKSHLIGPHFPTKSQSVPKCSQADEYCDSSIRIREIAAKICGISGRSIKKIPFLAFSKASRQVGEGDVLPIDTFLDHLENEIDTRLSGSLKTIDTQMAEELYNAI